MQRLMDAVEGMLIETIARGDTLAPGWRDEICAIARTMVAEEREACARLCEERHDLKIATTYDWTKQVGQDIAAAIRERSNVEVQGRLEASEACCKPSPGTQC